MKIQELRIGNYVHFKYGEDEYNTVQAIDPEQIDLQVITPFGVHPDDIKGIPLSEEWLLKLGFEPDRCSDNYYTWFNEDVRSSLLHRVHVETNFGFTTLQRYEDEIYIHIPVKSEYVHQLQNLHFALIGEELTIRRIER